MDGSTVPPGTIVVGLDAPPRSDEVLAWALEQAVLEHKDLTLVHGVGPEVEVWTGLETIDLREIIDAQLAAGRTFLDACAEQVRRRAPQVGVTQVLRLAGPKQALLSVSEGAHMIVVGSRTGVVGSGMLNSVNGALSRRVACPVVVAGQLVTGRIGGGVLVLADGIAGSLETLEFGFREARLRGLSVTVVHRLADALVPGVGPARRAEDPVLADLEADSLGGFQRTLLAKLLGEVSARFPDVTVQLLSEGSVVDGCLANASHQMDLVVAGSHHTLSAQQVVLGRARRAGDWHCAMGLVPSTATSDDASARELVASVERALASTSAGDPDGFSFDDPDPREEPR